MDEPIPLSEDARIEELSDGTKFYHGTWRIGPMTVTNSRIGNIGTMTGGTINMGSWKKTPKFGRRRSDGQAISGQTIANLGTMTGDAKVVDDPH